MVSAGMAKVITLNASPKAITFDFELASAFAGCGPKQGTVDLPSLVLASQELRGKHNLQYNKPAFLLRSRDIVKISLHGTSGPRTALITFADD